MALSDRSRESLLPSFLYSTSSACSFAATGAVPRVPPCLRPSAYAAGAGGGVPFSIQAPIEKIEMYSPAFYTACTAGGIASCGLTHMVVKPLDLVKCNMQGLCEQTVNVLQLMEEEGFEPNLVMLNLLINSFGTAGRHLEALVSRIVV